VREGYLELALQNPGRIKVIRAERGTLEVAAEIRAHLPASFLPRLGQG
jgi:thymidylate kinase